MYVLVTDCINTLVLVVHFYSTKCLSTWYVCACDCLSKLHYNYWIIALSYNYVNILNAYSLGGLHLISWTVLFKIKINNVNGGHKLDSGDVKLITLSVRYLSGLVL